MTTRIPPPDIHTIADVECRAILARNHVGRLAWCNRGQADLEPIHYVCAGDWIYGRTSPGAKLAVLKENFFQVWPVAFEVDEVEELFRWRSVVVHGSFYALDPAGSVWQRREWADGLALLRELVPGSLTPDDPVPFRTVVFAISMDEISGREAYPGQPG